MFGKVGMGGEIVILTVFENEHTTFLQKTFFKDQIWYRREFLQGVGRIGEDEVKLLFARLHETEHVATQRYGIIGVQFLQTVLDETVMVSVSLYADDVTAASRQQFQCDAACA